MQILLFTSDFYFYSDYYYCQYWSDTMGWREKKLQQWTVLWSGILCALHIWMKRRRYRYENNKYGEDNGFNAFSRKVWAQYDDDTPHNVSYSRVNKEKLLHSSLSLSSLLYPRLLYLYFFPRCNFQCTHSVRHKEGPFFCSQFQLLKLSLSHSLTHSLSIIVRHYTTITASLPPFIST